jgi:hypothetical protein
VITVSRHSRRYYRLRTPQTPTDPSVACSVRVEEETGQLYLAVGSGRRRMHLNPDEAWTLWRCLTEAVSSLGNPPEYLRTNLIPTTRRAS